MGIPWRWLRVEGDVLVEIALECFLLLSDLKARVESAPVIVEDAVS